MPLSLAPQVGRFIAATDVDNDTLLAVVLSAGARGEHRVNVLDARRAYALLTTFPMPGRARSGVTPLHADGATLIGGDDHSLVAFDPRSGALEWSREFPAPSRVRLHDVRAGRILVSIEREGAAPEVRLLRAADGADDAVLDALLAGAGATCLGPHGELAIAHMRTIEVVRAGAEKASYAIAPRRFGSVDVAAFDDMGARLAVGTRAGDVLVLDLKSGAVTEQLEMADAVRSVGFRRGSLWAMDARGRLRVGGDTPLAVDLDLSTYGGLLAEDVSTIALSDLETSTFRVRRLPGNEEVFATIPGFGCEAVGVAADGALLVADRDGVVRIDATSRKVARVAGVGSVHDVLRLANGTMAFVGASVQVIALDADEPLTLAHEVDDALFLDNGGVLITTKELEVEVRDVATGSTRLRVDLAETWVGETGEAVRFVHLGPNGTTWIHLTNGLVIRADAVDDVVHQLSDDGVLFAHPDGQSLFRVDERRLTRLTLPDFEESPPWELPVDADITSVHFSPSGRRLVLFHHNGRLSSFDVGSGRGVAVDAPETAAAERRPNEVYIVDLQTPAGCAFGRDESSIAWTDAGGITFADATTGRLRGRLLIATSGLDYAVSDGTSFDWPSAESNEPMSPELEATEAGAKIDTAALLSRRRAAILVDLTR